MQNDQEQQPIFQATLSLIVKDGRLLLYRKMRKVGKGCLNAPGGGPESGETLIQATIRETEEETQHNGVKGSGIACDPEHMEKVAVVLFHNNGGTEFSSKKTDSKPFTVEMHVYMITKWQGIPGETPEEMMNPTWYPFEMIPYHEMLPADGKWLPEVLAGKKIHGEFFYEKGPEESGPKQMILTSYSMREISGFPEPIAA